MSNIITKITNGYIVTDERSIEYYSIGSNIKGNTGIKYFKTKNEAIKCAAEILCDITNAEIGQLEAERDNENATR